MVAICESHHLNNFLLDRKKCVFFVLFCLIIFVCLFVFISRLIKHWKQLPREVADSSSFKTHLDVVLDNLLCVTMLEQRLD